MEEQEKHRGDTHDRLTRIEEHQKWEGQWIRQGFSSIEKRLGITHGLVMWILGLLGTAMVGLVVALLLRAP